MALALPDDVSRALAFELRVCRERAGLTQEDVAKRANLRHTTIYQRLEQRVREVRIPQLVAVGNVLGVPGWELLRRAYIRADTGDVPRQPSPP